MYATLLYISLKVKIMLYRGDGLSRFNMFCYWSCEMWELCCHLYRLEIQDIPHYHFFSQVLNQTKFKFGSILASKS